jgi:hypothetical protein
MNLRSQIIRLILLCFGILTVIGVVTACAAEPQTPAASSTPRMPTSSGPAQATSTPAKSAGQPLTLE